MQADQKKCHNIAKNIIAELIKIHDDALNKAKVDQNKIKLEDLKLNLSPLILDKFTNESLNTSVNQDLLQVYSAINKYSTFKGLSKISFKISELFLSIFGQSKKQKALKALNHIKYYDVVFAKYLNSQPHQTCKQSKTVYQQITPKQLFNNFVKVNQDHHNLLVKGN